MIIQVCVGSSCHLKGSAEIVELFQKAVEENHLENEICIKFEYTCSSDMD